MGCVGNTHNKHKHIQCDYVNIFILGLLFYFKWFSNCKTFLVTELLQKLTIVQIQFLSVTSQIRYIWARYNNGLL
jgi:hypothetical protein